MTFFLDHCVPMPIGKALRALDADVRILQEEFAPDAPDINWMPVVAGNNWIVVTDDNRIRRKEVERALFKELKLRGVFLPGGFPNLGLWVQAAKIVHWWPEIEKNCRNLKPGTGLVVKMGKVQVIRNL